jgi:hypothetical protein
MSKILVIQQSKISGTKYQLNFLSDRKMKEVKKVDIIVNILPMKE